MRSGNCHAADEQNLLNEICRILKETGPVIVWLGLAYGGRDMRINQFYLLFAAATKNILKKLI